MKKRTMAVTGASGYVASWVVHELLKRGHHVRATVRDPSNEAKVAHLHAMEEELAGTLELVAADLLEPGSFREAFEGCEVVMHTASPFHLGHGQDPQAALVEPALQGTRNVLNDVSATDTVTRVVLTSSVAAVFGDAAECAARGGRLDESHWNETSSLDHMPYPYSKTVAEREAWKIAEAQDRWNLVVVNPGFVMGPSLSKRTDATSVDWMIAMLNGRYYSGMWDFVSPFVDVRDVAIAHAEAARRPEAEGRHILSSGELSFLDVGRMIARDFPGKFRPPTRRVPKPIAWVIGPSKGFTRRYVRENIGHDVTLDHSRSEERLGIEYRPFQETLHDHIAQLVADGLVAER